MISFFAIASNDQSLHYLGQLFGSVGTVLVPSSGNTTMNIMSVIFKSLNTTALIIGAIIVTNTTIMGLIKTATEGEFLGKQWSSIWVPFRMVIGIASLFPTAAGYSVLQIIMMWVILQGVGAADSLWTVVLNYVSVFGSPYSTVQLPTTIGVQQSIKNLFADLTCEASLKASQGKDNGNIKLQWSDKLGSHPYYYCGQNPSSSFCTNPSVGESIAEKAGLVTQPTGSSGVSPTALSSVSSTMCSENTTSITCLFGPKFTPSTGACGAMTFGNPAAYCPAGSDIYSQAACAGYTAQQTALAWIVDVLYTTAYDLVNLDMDYLAYSQQAAGVNTPLQPSQTLQNYCQANNIPLSQCSVNYSNTQLPDASTSNGMSASDLVVKNIFWPCYLEAVVSGSQSGQCISGAPAANVDFISTSVTYYQNAINNAIASAMMTYLSNSSSSALTGSANSTWSGAQSTGWILAGAYYYTIASANASAHTFTIPPFSVLGPPSDQANPAGSYRNNLSAATALVNQINAQTSDPSSPTANIPGFNAMGGTMSGVSGGIFNAFSSALTGNTGETTNPLVAMANFGHTLTITAIVIFSVFMGLSIPLLIAAGYGGAPLALGVFSATNGLLEGAKMLFYGLYMILLAFMAWCFTTGGLIGVYTPLIPYIIFVSGAVGWFISVIEAMVAAPFVALGILSPSGSHEILGKADAGLMILFSTFLRPTLMIVGMMSAMILAPVVISLVNAGFSSVMASISSNPTLFELIIFISAYMTLVLTVLNKCFALIHIVPDRVLVWIGGPQGSAGSDAGEMTGAIKSATGAAAEGMGSMAKSGVEATGNKASSMGDKNNQDKQASDAKSKEQSDARAMHEESMGGRGKSAHVDSVRNADMKKGLDKL